MGITVKKDSDNIWFYTTMGSISAILSENSMDIEQLEVWIEYRGNRVATSLMTAAIEYAKNQGIVDIRLYCDAEDEDRQADLEGFYERLGFVFSGSDASMLLLL